MKQPDKYGNINIDEIAVYIELETDTNVRNHYLHELGIGIKREVLKKITNPDLRAELLMQLTPTGIEKKAQSSALV